MTAFRSLTDLELAAKHDQNPIVRPGDGRRGDWSMEPNLAPGERGAFGTIEQMVFDPRIETIPSRDPLPWIDEDGFRHEYRYTGAAWSPRPEFARPPVNRVLAEFRADGASAESWATFGDEAWTNAEIIHAEKVLAWLARLS